MAVAAAQRLMATANWESAYHADLAGCWSASSVSFALLAACGVPADSAEPSMLQVGNKN